MKALLYWKRPLLLGLIFGLVAPTTMTQPAPTGTISAPLAGVWMMTMEGSHSAPIPVQIVQAQNCISISYADGYIGGEFRGNALAAQWIESGKHRGGTGTLNLGANGNTMTGTWVVDPKMFNGGHSGQGQWTFTRSAVSNGPAARPCPDPSVTKLTLQAPELKVFEGETVSVPVYLLHPHGVSNVDWTLTFDPNVLQPEANILKGNLLTRAVGDIFSRHAGVIKGSFLESTGLTANSAGTVAVVKFHVVGKKGASSRLQLATTRVETAARAVPPIDYLHGSIRVIDKSERPAGTGPTTPAGAGPSGIDVHRCLMMVVERIPVEWNYDVDHDRKITSGDAFIIAQRRLAAITGGK